jgi:hypothetical protein
VPAQFLPVTRYEQQRVAGARPEHQHDQDAGALPVHRQAALGQQVDDRLGGGERHAGRDDRQDPQHRAAVGQQQQDDDHGQRGVQQRTVDALEDLDCTGGAGGRAGDMRAQPWIAARSGRLQAGNKAADVGVVAEVSPDDRLDGLVVAGRDRPSDRAGHRGQRAEGPRVGDGLARVRRGDPGWAGVDHHGRVQALGDERARQVQLLGGLRAGRPVGRGVVLFRAHQLGRQWCRDGDDENPEHQYQVLGPPAARQAGDPPGPAWRGARR